jgi:hypothetical protein
MSREVLLTLLGTLLVINVGVLISIGLLGRRGRVRRTGHDGPAAVNEAAAPVTTTVPAMKATPATGEAPATTGASGEFDRGLPALESPITPGQRPRVVTAAAVVSALPVTAAQAEVARAEAGAESAAVAVAVAEPDSRREPGKGPESSEPGIGENGHVAHELDAISIVDGTLTKRVEPATVAIARNGSPPRTADGKPRRSRRFVLPPLEEDSDRSARAIEAFLGEASAAPPLVHPERLHRRRHRARRTAGMKANRTSLIVDLVGYGELAVVAGETQAVRLAGALAEALWRSARVGDEVRELAPGRIQLVLDCDAAGADAFAERARASVAPWLSVMPVPVYVRIAPSTDLQGEATIPQSGSPGPDQ